MNSAHCLCFYPAFHVLSVRQQLLKGSCLAEKATWGVRRRGTYSFLSFHQLPFFFLPLTVFTPPSLFPLTPSVFFLICPEIQQRPPPFLPSHALSLCSSFPHLSSTITPHPHLSFGFLSFLLSLNLLTPFSFYLSHFCPHFLTPPAISIRPSSLPLFAMTPPLSHDRTRGRNQMTSFSPFTWSQSSGCERKLCPPKTLHRLWRYVLCCPYRKVLWSDWNFWGPWENMSVLGPSVSLWQLLPQSMLRH